MRFWEAVDSLQQEHPEDKLNPLYTPWGEAIQKEETEKVWQEYPRPQFQRDHFTCLNGFWDCCFISLKENSVIPGQKLLNTQRILVPFSPEALLSGVGRQLLPEEYLWYEKQLTFSQRECNEKEALKKRCILHFDGVDQQAVVYVNGVKVCEHLGGYLPFLADITDFVSDVDCLLQIRVRDESDTSYYTRGKQTLKRGGMYYTAQSGIWQSVWYEWVPENAIWDYQLTMDPDQRKVTYTLYSPKPFSSVQCTIAPAVISNAIDCLKDSPDTVEGCEPADNIRTLSKRAAQACFSPKQQLDSSDSLPCELKISVSACRHSPIQAPTMVCSCATALTLTLSEEDMKLWSPEAPFLYPLCIIADEEVIHSYFAMRIFRVEKDQKGIFRFCLNHKPYFLHGILDQGYWSDGLMTAPCEEAFLYDILLAKVNGFNMLRKHIKIEPLRWYYHCDQLGMIVWQDMVSGGSTYHLPLVCYMPTLFPHISNHTRDNHYWLFSRTDEKGRLSWEKECLDTIEHLKNVPSLAVWVPFNEGWGQFDAARIAQLVKEKDPSRPVDHASGWFDQKGGDFRSIHNYFRPLRVKLDGKRAYVISEYGGYACHIKGHSSVDRSYGYKKYDSLSEMSDAINELFAKQLMPLVEQGLSGAVYTQLSDVEEEVNGLVTYDRRIVKYHLPLS